MCHHLPCLEQFCLHGCRSLHVSREHKFIVVPRQFVYVCSLPCVTFARHVEELLGIAILVLSCSDKRVGEDCVHLLYVEMRQDILLGFVF